MRIKSWASSIDRTATIDEFLKALRDGNTSLALRIQLANTGDNLQKDWLPIDFEALRGQVITERITFDQDE